MWSLDDASEWSLAVMWIFYSGHKEVFKVRLASGREVRRPPPTHPFLTLDGWVPLGELAVGARLQPRAGFPNRLDPADGRQKIILLAHMIGDGSCVKRQPIRYASIDEQNLARGHDGRRALRRDSDPRRLRRGARDHVAPAGAVPVDHGKRNPSRRGWTGWDYSGFAVTKFVPAQVFALPNDQVALFLRHLWATDRSVSWDARAGHGRVYYASTSPRQLTDDVAQLVAPRGCVRANQKR